MKSIICFLILNLITSRATEEYGKGKQDLSTSSVLNMEPVHFEKCYSSLKYESAIQSAKCKLDILNKRLNLYSLSVENLIKNSAEHKELLQVKTKMIEEVDLFDDEFRKLVVLIPGSIAEFNPVIDDLFVDSWELREAVSSIPKDKEKFNKKKEKILTDVSSYYNLINYSLYQLDELITKHPF